MIRNLLIIFHLLLSIQAFSQIDFLDYQIYYTGSHPEVVCIGDVNNDGLNDVVLGTSFYFNPARDYKIFVFLQNDQGKLDSAIIYPYPNSIIGITCIDIADVNHDSLQDIIIGYEDSIGIFYQNQAGTLDPVKAYYCGQYVMALKAGDLNHDGWSDIAVSPPAQNYLRIFYQNDSGFTIRDYNNPSEYFYEIEIDDLNDDGLNDIVSFSITQGEAVRVFFQDTLGEFNSFTNFFPTLVTPVGLEGLATGDVNNDGKNDIIATIGGNMGIGKVIVWFQNAVTHTFPATPIQFAAYDCPEAIEVADLDCNGKNEIIVAHGGWPNFTTYEQNPTSYFNIYQQFPTPTHLGHYNPQGLCIGDINNDGKKDVVLAHYQGKLVFILNNSLAGSYITFNTVLSVDTVFSGIITENSFYTKTHYDTTFNYLLTGIDSFMLINTFHIDSIRYDSTLYASTHYCDEIVEDSLTFTSYIIVKEILSSDTIFYSHHTDTTNLFEDIKIYPVPTTGHIWIELPYPYDTKGTSLSIYNSIGSLIYSEIYTTTLNKREYNFNELPQGIYLLNFHSQFSKTTRKVVISR